MQSKLSAISDAERTPLVAELLAILEAERKCQQQLEGEKQQLEGEKQQLEGEKQQLEGEKKRLQAELDRLRRRLARYEPEVWYEGKPAAPAQPRASYSLDAENQRRQKRRRRPKSPGRQPTALKFAEAQRFEDVYPQGVAPVLCRLVRERAVWRLEEGKAVLVGYRIYAGPDGKEPRLPGVTPRCEYGVEILVVLSFLKYIVGISLDKACIVLQFFCGLTLSKSQADALLRQLAKHWQAEYETLCDLIAHAAVVHLDETGWKVGADNCSLWLFASQLHAVFVFGCRKDAATLDDMLPPDVFTGTGISDDAAVYRERFRQGQKCWAHLLRKLIKLALLYPRKRTYQRLLDELLTLYRDAKRVAADKRLSEATRRERAVDFATRLFDVVWPQRCDDWSNLKPHERDFANFIDEMLRLWEAEELFTFVWVPDVAPTNNAAERQLRNPALDRKAGRTNRTAAGAQRRSIIVSVLESLRHNLAQKFTLAAVLREVTHWMKEGISLFAKQWQELQHAQAPPAPATG